MGQQHDRGERSEATASGGTSAERLSGEAGDQEETAGSEMDRQMDSTVAEQSTICDAPTLESAGACK